MNTHTLFQAFLTVHLIGFALFVGTTLADFFFFRRFWMLYDRESSAVKIAATSVARFPAIMRFGILLAIVAGVGMMALTNGVFGEQVWMRIKIPLVIAALLNTLIIRRRQGSKLNISLEADQKMPSPAILKIKRQLSLFYFTQFILCFAIILVSVFKFN